MDWIKKNFSLLSGRLSDALEAPLELKSRLLPVLLMILCLTLMVSIRLFPAYFPDLRKEAALKAVDARFQDQFKNETEKSKVRALEALAGAEKQIYAAPEDFSRKIDEEFLKLKDPYQDAQGFTYLMESDPYAWAAWTRNILLRGRPGDRIVNGKSYDSKMLAPAGLEVFHFTGLFYLTAFCYRVFSILNSNVPLEHFLLFIPVFYAACFFLGLYLFVRRWSTDLVAFMAVLLAGCIQESIQRGSAGWYDFDMLSLLLALAVSWSLLEAFRGAVLSWKKVAFFSVLAAFFEGLYAKMWLGWWFMLVVAALFFVLAIASRLFPGEGSSRERGRGVLRYIVSAAIFISLSLAFASIFTGVDILERLRWLKSFLRFNTALSTDIWPNVLYTISELNSLSLRGLAARLYGPWMFLGVVGSVLWVLLKEWKTPRRDVALLLFAWFLFMLVASFKGNRFVVYLAVPSFIFFALALIEYVPAFITKKWGGIRRVLGFAVYLVLIGFLVKGAFNSAVRSANNLKPEMNDAWYQALAKLEKDSPKDAIINSWWDYGSWFRYYGDRRVIFDGQSQGGFRSYWMARALLAEDEAKAVRILRMLDQSGEKTFSGIAARVKDLFRSQALLDQMLNVDEAKARELLAAEHFTDEGTRAVLAGIFGKPSPAYFIVERSMLWKISSISFLGNWDFRKLLIAKHRKEPKEKVLALLESAYGLSEEEAAKLYEQQTGLLKEDDPNEVLSERLDFSSFPIKGEKGKELIRFDNGVVFNTATREVLYYAFDGKFRVPRRAVIWENGVRSEIKDGKADGEKTVVISVQKDEYRSLVASDGLADSLLVRLYFLKGAGLRFFKPFHADEEHNIFIYEIDWEAAGD